MFRKFAPKEDLSTSSQIKSSALRAIKSSITENNPSAFEETGLIDIILPKKAPVQIAKTHSKVSIITLDGVPLFFAERDGSWMPTLRLLHKYPNILKQMRVDKGAIKFIFSGANMMCPGFTHPMGHIPDDIEEGDVVAIMCEGKEHAAAIGIAKMSAETIRSVNKGIAVEVTHYLNDQLWTNNDFK